MESNLVGRTCSDSTALTHWSPTAAAKWNHWMVWRCASDSGVDAACDYKRHRNWIGCLVERETRGTRSASSSTSTVVGAFRCTRSIVYTPRHVLACQDNVRLFLQGFASKSAISVG